MLQPQKCGDLSPNFCRVTTLKSKILLNQMPVVPKEYCLNLCTMPDDFDALILLFSNYIFRNIDFAIKLKVTAGVTLQCKVTIQQ